MEHASARAREHRRGARRTTARWLRLAAIIAALAAAPAQAQSGARMVADIAAGGGSRPAELTPFGGALFFSAQDDAGTRDLWRSDGTQAGTSRVVDVAEGDPYGGVGELALSGGRLFFASSAGEQFTNRRSTLWVSDGTPAGSAQLATFDAHDNISSLAGLTDVGGTLFFINYGEVIRSFELWKSDGTQAGTALVASFAATDDMIEVVSMLAVGDTLYFAVYDNVRRVMLWRSDGTQAGTQQVALDGRWSDVSQLVSIGDTVYFITGEDGSSALWRVDPGAGSAALVREVGPYAGELTAVRDRLFFSVGDGGPGELWTSKGTSWSTVRLRGFAGPVVELAALRGRLLFSADDGGRGQELYSSTGAGSATFRVADIAPGAEGSSPHAITPAAPPWRALLAASDGRSGVELWRTSGSRAGTQLVADIAPGPASSDPSDVTVVGERTFFVADDGTSGRELWVAG